MRKILFVCLGNICRSPTAEGIFRALVEEAGLADQFTIDSAGTGAWHTGEPPDRRMTAAAKEAGYTLKGRARGVQDSDFDDFDLILAMDKSNFQDLQARNRSQTKIKLFRDFDPKPGNLEVPDPYYGGAEGFREVVAVVQRTAAALLEAIK